MLPYQPAFQLAETLPAPTWLVDELWGEGAVGILGGEPKCCKSFLALELAVAIASGTPCLGRFGVARPGPVLLYAAEDAPPIVKSRLMGIAAARGLDLRDINIQVITAEKIRLDQPGDVEALTETVAEIAPRLLILDPFVRLHRIDENSSAEVAMILENLRLLQRRHGCSILIVHHAKKNGGATRAGQALRGSSEFHAWGDSNLYMRRTSERLMLSIEHRAAASSPPIPLALRGDQSKVALEIQTAAGTNRPPEERPTSVSRIEQALAATAEPLSLSALRQASGLRTATLCETLKGMLREGLVRRTDAGYALTTT